MIGRLFDDRSARLWLIHGAFTLSVPIYMFLVPLLQTQFQAQTTPYPEGVSPRLWGYAAFALLSLIQVIAAFNIGNWFKAVAAQAEDSAPVYLNKRLTETILMDAFLESIAIYGLVGLLIGLQTWQALSLMFVSLIFLMIVIGRIKGWVDEYRRRLHQDRHPV